MYKIGLVYILLPKRPYSSGPYDVEFFFRRDAAVDSPLFILSQSMMQELPKMLCVTPK